MTSISWNSIDSFSHSITDATLTSQRPCPICGSDESCEILCMNDFQFFTDSSTVPKRATVRNVQCTVCQALYLNPVYTPHGFASLFSEAGCSYGSTEGRPKEQISWLTDQGLLNAGRSILDVGCYDGRFLALLPSTVQRIGVDIDEPAIERGQSKYGDQGVELIHGNFDNFKLSSSPDAITMFHVLEHLPDPVATLINLRNQAHDKTMLVVEVPILENGLTNDINSFFSAQHMTHFSRNSLRNALNRAGWEIMEDLEQPDYNGYRILAKPSIPQYDGHSCPEDIISLGRLMEHRHKAIQNVQEKLLALGDTEKVVIWGGGMHTEFLYQLTDAFTAPNRRFLIIDNDPIKQGKSWRGIHIFQPSCLTHLNLGEIKLLISSYAGTPSITCSALELGVTQENIVKLYDTIKVY